MASQFSEDPCLGEICLLVLFFSDGQCVVAEDYDSKGRLYVSGDIISLERNGSQSEAEICVILGWGETEDEATEMARTYVRRLAKWHGTNGTDEQLEVYGYDLSQSQLFQDQNSQQ